MLKSNRCKHSYTTLINFLKESEIIDIIEGTLIEDAYVTMGFANIHKTKRTKYLSIDYSDRGIAITDDIAIGLHELKNVKYIKRDGYVNFKGNMEIFFDDEEYGEVKLNLNVKRAHSNTDALIVTISD